MDWAKFEAAIEGDDSKVPGMLVSVLHDLGDALLAMAQEEVAEALAGHDVEPDAPVDGDADADDDDLVPEERAHILAAKKPALRAFRRGLAHAKLRSGKTISAKTAKALRGMMADHEDAIEMTRSAIRKHKKAITALGDMLDGDSADSDDADDDDPEADTTPQSTAQDTDDEGQRSASLRRRQADLLRLSVTP